MVANMRKISSREAREGASADVEGAVGRRRGVLATEDMNVNVFGMLVRRQDARANHEACFIEFERDRDLLDTADQARPKFRLARAHVEQRRHPTLGDNNDVRFPPLFESRIDAVPKCEHLIVFVNDFIGLRARAVEPAAKCMFGIRFIVRLLTRAGKAFAKPIHAEAVSRYPTFVPYIISRGVSASRLEISRHEEYGARVS